MTHSDEDKDLTWLIDEDGRIVYQELPDNPDLILDEVPDVLPGVDAGDASFSEFLSGILQSKREN